MVTPTSLSPSIRDLSSTSETVRETLPVPSQWAELPTTTTCEGCSFMTSTETATPMRSSPPPNSTTKKTYLNRVVLPSFSETARVTSLKPPAFRITTQATT